ncbi:MAG: MFS transporter [Alphaproteobacteria bacterium]|nr:MFS transporter [Alphaproteobacteria bacterium]
MSAQENNSQAVSARWGINPMIPYLGGIATWFAANGLQFVMVPTLVIITLGGTAGDLAAAQVALAVPQVFLMMFAGSLADKSDSRVILLWVNLLAAIPPIVLGWLTYSGALEYWHIIVFGLLMSASFAFMVPTRDALLSRVATGNIQNSVMMALIAQFAAQLLGYILDGAADHIAGPWAILAMQTIALVIGFLVTLALPDFPPVPSQDDERSGWKAGFSIVWKSSVMRPVILSSVGTGIFFIGIFMVTLPLIVTDIFGGGQLEISILNFTFWGGTIVSTVIMMTRRPVERRGRAMVGALIVGCFALMLVPIAPTFGAVCAIAGAWGLAAGVNMTMARTIVQVEAPPDARGRVLAFYSLGFMGSAPVGATLSGIVTEFIGPLATTFLCAVSMLILVTTLIAVTPVWGIMRKEDEPL